MKNEFFRWLGRSTLLLIGIGSFSLLGSWGLYLQVHKVDQESPEEFRLLLSRWKETGVRGVFLRTFQNHDDRLHSLRPRGSDIGVYFENTLGMPVVYPLLETLHSPLPLYAWTTLRWMDWEEGRRYGHYLDPRQPRTRSRMLSLVSTLSDKPLAGILLQDDLVVRSAEEKELRWKDKGAFLNRLLQEIKSRSGDREVVINVFYEVPTRPDLGTRWYGQQIDSLLASGADSIALMLYPLQIKEELHLSDEELRLYMERTLQALEPHAARTYVKVQVQDFKSLQPVPLETVEGWIRLIPAKFKGVVLTPITTDSASMQYLDSLLTRLLPPSSSALP